MKTMVHALARAHELRTCRPGTVLLEIAPDASTSGKIEKWVQIAKQGEFRGHAAGAFTLDTDAFAQMIRNFRANQSCVPLDFEHASEGDPSQGEIPTKGAPAQGWVTDLEVRADGNLWGLAQFGELASKYIRDGQYKFLSPAIVFGSKDQVTGNDTGARLSSVGIVNSPFLTDMQPLAARRDGLAGNSQLDDPFAGIRHALGLAENATPTQCKIAVELVGSMRASGLDVRSHTSLLARELRLPMTASLEDILSAVRLLAIPSSADHAAAPNADPSAPGGGHTEQSAMTIPEETTKLITENAEIKVRLSTKDAEVTALTAKVTAATAELTAVKAELSAKGAECATVGAERDALKKQVEEQADKALNTKIDTALLSYGESKGLKQLPREVLLTYAKTQPEKFDKEYPAIPANQAHLMRSIATGRNGEAPATTGGTEASEEIDTSELPTIKDLVPEYVAKGMSFEEAHVKAFNKVQKEVKKLAAKSKKTAA